MNRICMCFLLVLVMSLGLLVVSCGGGGGGSGLGIFPTNSDPATVELSQLMVTASDTPSAGLPLNDEDGFVALEFDLSVVGRGIVGIDEMEFAASGTGDELNDILSVRMVYDSNGDGVYDDADSVLPDLSLANSPQVYFTNNGTIKFKFNEPHSIQPSTTQRWFVIYELNGLAALGESFNLRLTNVVMFPFVGASVQPNFVDLITSTNSITEKLTIIVGDLNPLDQLIINDGSGITLMHFSMFSPLDVYTVLDGFTFTFSMADGFRSSDVDSVELFLDSNNDGVAEQSYGSMQVNSNKVTFLNLNYKIDAKSRSSFILEADLSGSAVVPASIQASLADELDVHFETSYRSVNGAPYTGGVLTANRVAIADIQIPGGSRVFEDSTSNALDGTGSKDPDVIHDLESYQWSISNMSNPDITEVTIDNATTDSATLQIVNARADYTVEIKLEVESSDGTTGIDTVIFEVLADNDTPEARITLPSGESIVRGNIAAINGSASIDPDVDDVLSYEWTIVSAPPGVFFIDTAIDTSTMRDPLVQTIDNNGFYEIQLSLKVTDLDGASNTVLTVLTVLKEDDHDHPILQSSEWIDVDGDSTVNVNDKIIMTFNEPVQVVGTGNASDIALPVSGDFLGTGLIGFDMQVVGGSVVEITLGNNPVITSLGLFQTNGLSAGSPSGIGMASNHDVIRDIAGNLASPVELVDIIGSDRISPTINSITLNNVSSYLNGTGTAAGTMQCGENAWTIDLEYSDVGGSGVDSSSVTLILSGDPDDSDDDVLINVGTVPVGRIAAGQSLLPALVVLSASDTEIHYMVRSSTEFPESTSSTSWILTAGVSDLDANVSGPVAFNFKVKHKISSTRPFEERMRWFVRFDRDIWSLSAQYDSNGVATINGTGGGSFDDANDVADFLEDLYLFGLVSNSDVDINPGYGGNDDLLIPNSGGFSLDVVMQSLLKDLIIEKLQDKWYEDVTKVYFSHNSGEFDTWPAPGIEGYSIFTFAKYSRISCGGRAVNSNAPGESFYNNGASPNSQHKDNYDYSLSTVLKGMFPATVFENEVNGGGEFRTDFDALLPSDARNGGGVLGGPVGDAGDNLDGERIEYILNRSGGRNDVRTQTILQAMDTFANVCSRILAHEVAHSMSVVANGKMPRGLYGGDGVNFSGSTSHHIDLTTSPNLFTGGAENMMISSPTYAGSKHVDTKFSPLVFAYLKEQVIIDDAD